MKRIRFTGKDPLQKEFSIAVRRNINNYFREKGISTKGNASMYFKAVILLAVYIAPFVLLLTVPMNGWMALVLVILMGIGEAGVGMSVMHDAAHGAFSGKKWVNGLFASTMYLLGSSVFNWKIQHNLYHHSFTNVYGFDMDIDTKGVIRLCQHAPLKKFNRLQQVYAFFFYGLMTLSKMVTDLSILVKFNRTGITAEQNRKTGRELMKLILAKSFYFLVIIGLPVLITGFTWWQVLIGFAVLHVTAGMIMSTIFQMAHVVEGAAQPLPNAEGVIEEEWAVHQLNTTSDFARKNIFFNWYAGGLNFQIEHHLFSNICHIHYRKIAPIVERTAREFGLVYNLKPAFSDALVSHFHRLRALGRSAGMSRPSVRIKPQKQAAF